ncbi:MAG: Tm-1-like ATP-binding domain-containing protein, partial [Actinobacteria bacterium]|nr:Tm-1-like ATP-binding domain-containing protein [Actinomycetota bacterium]
NPAKGPVEWFIPMKGFCSHSVEGAPIHDHESDMAYVDELKKQLRDDIPINTRDTDINDPVFAAEIAKRLIELMKKKYG